MRSGRISRFKRANLQTKTWISSPFMDVSRFTDPTKHGFSYDEGSSILIPTLSIVASKPADVPEPCFNCRTCVKVTYLCHHAGVSCSEFFIVQKERVARFHNTAKLIDVE